MENTEKRDDNEIPPKLADDTASVPKICRSISECRFISRFWRAHSDRDWAVKGDDDTGGSDRENGIEKNEDDVAGVSLCAKTRLILSAQPSHNFGRGRRGNLRNRNMRFHQDLKTDDLDGMVVMFQAKANESIAVVLSSFPSYYANYGTDTGTGNDTGKEEEQEEEPEEEQHEEKPTEEKEKEEPKDEQCKEESKEEQQKQEIGMTDNVPAQNSDAQTIAETANGDSNTSTRYEIVLGTNKNTATTIRRSVFVDKGDKEPRSSKTKSKFSAAVTIPSRVCRGFGVNTKTSDDEDGGNNACWTSYWICLSNSNVYVGMGCIPGKQCFGIMEAQKQGENPAAAGTLLPVRYVGIGNDTRHHNGDSTEIRNLVVTNVPPCLESALKEVPPQDELPIVCLPPVACDSSSMDIDEDTETLELKRYMEQYKAECLVRKRRAQKYGTQYKEQPMKDFLPWTMAKRLLLSKQQETPATGSNPSDFVAGDIDFLDPKEVSKREARLARFATGATAESKTDGGDKAASRTTQNRPVPVTDGLPVEQAWDKETMLRPVRRDPPPYLWKECPSNAETIETFKNPANPFAMYDETTKAATWVEDKIHVSAIDWAAFKQIGNDDLLKHFGESYGPVKYIEWLGDVNCNICYGSKHSAARALVCLANEVPSPPPSRTTPTDESTEASKNNKDTTSPATASSTVIDLGCMTWRFGKKPIRKLSNDRRGRKGTTARYLLRMATTEDILVERPNSWPEPPGGFSSDRVLGPKSDFANPKRGRDRPKKQPNPQKQYQAAQQQNRRGSSSKTKRKRQRGNNGNSNSNSSSNNEQNTDKQKQTNNIKTRNNKSKKTRITGQGLLNRGLSSSRAGFSVEEMEKERQSKKRQKTC